jgi:hypothetical protein
LYFLILLMKIHWQTFLSMSHVVNQFWKFIFFTIKLQFFYNLIKFLVPRQGCSRTCDVRVRIVRGFFCDRMCVCKFCKIYSHFSHILIKYFQVLNRFTSWITYSLNKRNSIGVKNWILDIKKMKKNLSKKYFYGFKIE